MKNNFEVLCLSLDRDIDRKQHMLDVFIKLGIPVNFFKATTENEITKDQEEYFKNCDFYEWDINQKAVMATFISHKRMLEYSVENNKNLLIIEDDIDYILPIDFKIVLFERFDLFNVGLSFSCYSYFVSSVGSKKILNELDGKTITQAYDWELSKLNTINRINSATPHFIQVENKFKSNIAPNGYKRY